VADVVVKGMVRPGTADAVAVIPALIANAGDAAGWRYVEFFTANIRNPHAARLCPRVQPVLRLVRRARPDAGDDPAVRCRALCRAPPGDPFGAYFVPDFSTAACAELGPPSFETEPTVPR
jgi:hypothetical protein